MSANTKSPEDQAAATTFLQAKWFPATVALVSLAISIGGHTFTRFHSIALAEQQNNVSALTADMASTQQADVTQDRALQTLYAELQRQRQQIAALQSQLSKHQHSDPTGSGSSAQLPAGFEAVQAQAEQEEAMAANEQAPLPNGVSENFDALVAQRMKPHWEAPPKRSGEKTDDEDVVVLQFQLERNGRIRDVQIANTSGMIEFDNSVIKAALRMREIPEVASMSDESYRNVANFRMAFSPNALR